MPGQSSVCELGKTVEKKGKEEKLDRMQQTPASVYESVKDGREVMQELLKAMQEQIMDKPVGGQELWNSEVEAAKRTA